MLTLVGLVAGDAAGRQEREPAPVQVPREVLPGGCGRRDYTGDHAQTVLPSGTKHSNT